MNIRPLAQGEQPPLKLMLLADPSEAMIRSYGPEAFTWVLEDNDFVIGVYVLKPLADGGMELMNLAIEEERQGQGLGYQLLQHAMETAISMRAAYMLVGTGNSSVGQLYLYQKAGLRIDHVIHDYFTAHYDEPLVENGIPCRDRIVLKASFHTSKQ
ncbi:GNAT family N-acetyltransferase [Paenibacillus sp. 1001270B_150601_E10]|uniref:GNAT family N-acetyltransferase n=1 Tax=Paenibacillus sp. 1001270B_150601_E10 TaxID=2787079 RepID=UPI0018A00F7F|nr:GNAT family N-acetyltransferase [Paenibacillus sp. 1001270B_150601_E10]